MPDVSQNFLMDWDKVGERYFESGTDRGVLYQINSDNEYVGGVEWNGLTAVNSTPGGAEANELWADNMKYAVLRSAETYGGTIEAYTYPEEFKQNNGEADLVSGIPGITASGQSRKAFGFSFRTKVGNDIDGLDHGYKIHIVYNATVNPSEKAYQTINDSPDAITMSWEFQTTPIKAEGTPLKNATAHIEIDTTKFEGGSNNQFIKDLEQYLYGTPASGSDPAVEAKLPLPSKIVEIYNGAVNPSMSLSLDFNIDPNEDFWGYKVGDLQSNVAVGSNDIISGELKYIADYSSAFGPGLDEGNYMVAHFTASAADATITVELDQQQVLDPDGLVVLRIRDKDSQTLKVVASATGEETVTKYYSLSGLTCLANNGQG